MYIYINKQLRYRLKFYFTDCRQWIFTPLVPFNRNSIKHTAVLTCYQNLEELAFRLDFQVARLSESYMSRPVL